MREIIYKVLFVIYIIFLFVGVTYIALQDPYLAYKFSDYGGRYDDTVYVSDQGEKVFHSYSECEELRKYYISMEAKDAILIGYEPCWECCTIKERKE
ncbi:MAG: hypothetical protein J6J16_03485 [Lachnospiraceae bacterium]|nr:hypothetical protein [Lachnospiraceae bacterium]